MKQTNAIRQPKFKVGQQITTSCHHKTYNKRRGQVKEMHNIFALLDINGQFETDGLHVDKEHFNQWNSKITWIDDLNVRVDVPERDMGQFIHKAHTEYYRFHHYSYSVQLQGVDWLVQLPERNLRYTNL